MLSEEWKSMDVLGLSKYMCSESGKVLNIKSNKILKGSIITERKVYNLTNDDDKVTSIRAHILLSKLFTDIPEKLVDDYLWIPLTIFGLERYKICEEGKILSTKGEIMKTHFQSNAVKICFKDNTKTINFRVCILMATIFLPNPDNLKHIKFKDGDHNNVNKNNLEWSDNTCETEDPLDEIWLPLVKFPKYQINPKGIRNARTHDILKPQFSSEGYSTLKLCIDNKKSINISLHGEIAKQYIPNSNPTKLIEVNHKNGIKDDFRIENLEWVTHKQNIQHAVDTGLLQKTKGKGRKIELLDENYEVILTFNTSKEAGEHVGYNGDIVRYRMKSSKSNITIINKYILRYKVEPDLEGEIWKNANTLYININNKYKVSNYGRVKNNKNKILAPSFNHKGYGKVVLSNFDKNFDKSSDSLLKNCYVHVLVAYAFLQFEENRDDYQVNHKDKNPLNNNINNLEILTISDHSIKDKGKPVLCVTKNNEYYVFNSQSVSNFLPDMKVQSIRRSIINKTEYKDHYWYNYDDEEAQEIISKFRSKGIIQSIPPKIEIIPVITSLPKRKLRLIIIS